MNPFLRPLNRAATSFNNLPLWKGTCPVWGQRMTSHGFERWLYLRAHRLGLMGREDRRFFAEHIRPGMRVLDIGSNLGLYSILMAKLTGPSGRVTCFEPDADLFQSFQANCRLNEVDWVEGHNLALGSRPARLTLHKMIINSGDNHFGQRRGELFRHSIEAEVVALDSFLPDLRVDFVKIDIQGWELEALRGMQRTLAAQPAVQVYFEFFPDIYQRSGTTYRDLVDFLHEAGFKISDPKTGRTLSLADLIKLAESMQGMKYTNLLATRGTPPKT